MFDGMFKPKFYSKCKSMVKITKTRIDTVKRKKNSVCKYLKNDIVDLLKNNLDYNAYCRAEGLIEETRRLSCYELLEQFCICVASNVSLLQKSSRCPPDECREAISSLVYAAARVSEVPELRDLRSLFTDRYGNSLEQFVNPELVKRFKAEPPSMEVKVEMLQEIAREHSIKWDAKSLEQRLYTPQQPTNPKTNQDKTIENRNREEESLKEDQETKPKIEKQESLPEKMIKSDLMTGYIDSPTAGKPKPRSVRRRFANPPLEDTVDTLKQSSKNMRSDSMEKAVGEGNRRMSRRTISWQPRPSNVPDFDEVAARVDALTRN